MLLHIPHSSSYIPEQYLDQFTISKNQLDDLSNFLSDLDTDVVFGNNAYPKLKFPYSRVFVDVERFEENEPMEKYGMGMFYTKDHRGNNIRRKLSNLEKAKLKCYYDNHQHTFSKLVESEIERYSTCNIIDCHSYPTRPFFENEEWEESPQVCISTNKEQVNKDILNFAKDHLSNKNIDWKVNTPYEGSFIPKQFIGDCRVTSLMLEIRRDVLNSLKEPIQELLEKINDYESNL